MTQDVVNEYLRSYKANCARLEHLRIEAANMERNVEREKNEALAGEAIKAQQYSGMPHSGRISKPVEDLVIRFTDGRMPISLADWVGEKDALMSEICEVAKRIALVDEWLLGLTEREQIVIREHVINGMPMADMAYCSRKFFAHHISAETIRRIKKSALEKIYAIAK